ncbi:MAG: hypothetical protein BGO50_10745 [Rhodanobacter sp. 67-28]|nr:MAG: hypothetical protein BGO50_10745 [Rhodanobacter sp. 67-28]
MAEELLPTLALLLHTTSSSVSSMPNDRQMVLTMHGIQRSQNGSTLGPARIMSPLDAQEFGYRLIGDQSSIQRKIELLPEGLLRETSTSLTWFRPPQRSHQNWRTGEGREVLEAVLPGLIFHVENGVLFVAAYAGTERPSLATPLFHAPMGNIHDDQCVCTGNVTLPRHQDHSAMRAWERVLLATNYTHINHPQTLASADDVSTDDLMAFWRKRKRYTTPPNANLMRPLKMTLSRWLAKLTGAEEAE